MRKALICTPQVPTPDRDSGSQRIDDAIRFLQDQGWQIGLLSERCVDPRYSERLKRRNVRLWIDDRPSVQHPALAWKAHIALLCFWKTAERWMPLLRQRSPQTRLIVDSIDLHFLRESRQAFQQDTDGAPGLLDPEMGFDITGELNTYAAADAVLTVSETERRLVNSLLGDPQRAFCVPDCEETAPPERGFAQRRGILFVGNFGHAPNHDAIRFLCQEILPRLDAEVLQEHPIAVVGNAPPESIREMASKAGIEVRGWVPSLDQEYRRALMTVAPLRFGAGTKRKVLQSLAAGTPCVSTPIGVEGLELEDGRHVLVSTEAGSFAAAVHRLATDAKLWQELSSQGQQCIQRRHSREAVSGQFVAAIEAVLARPSRWPDLAQQARSRRQHWMKRQYEQLLERIRSAVFRHLPTEARILVVSRGDDEMLDLEGRTARHFPSDPAGAYLGYHPADGDWAVQRLEQQSQGGYDHFLLPATALWWLEHYPGLAAYLEENGVRVVDRPDTCLIWRLGQEGSHAKTQRRKGDAKQG